MAKSLMFRFVGLGLALVAAASLLLTGFGLVQTWRWKGRVTQSLQSGLDVISSTLVATSEGLTAINQSLEATSGSLKSLQDAAQSAGGSIHSQVASIQSLSTLFGKDWPDALTGVQTAMIGAQVGAKEVEDTLAVLTSTPAFAASPYDPPVLLSTALSGVASGLGALPGPMQAAAGNLSKTSGDLTSLETTITNFADSLEQLRGRLDEARKVLDRYQEHVDSLGERLSRLRAGLPQWVRWAAWGISFLLVWLGILQVFGLGRGLHMMIRGE